ncbi:MAG: PKD domain-containing protein [Parcubacteria group bacterium]
MKKLVFLFIVVMLFSSCEEYEFQDEEKTKPLYTEISLKSGQGELTGMDTVNVKADIQVVFKAITYNGNPTEWHWDLGDGNFANGQQIDHMYTEEGVYDVSVTVTDGSYTYKSEIVVIVGDIVKGAVFSLYSADPPNSEGKIKYVISGAKGYVPNPPVPETGPFGYQGSNPGSDWEVIELTSSTEDDRVYWELVTYNEVYSQAYGGFNDKNEFIWAVMDESRFYSAEYEHPRIGFLNGELVEEEDFYVELLGDSGDDGDDPEIRFEVDEAQNRVNVFVNIADYATTIDSPKVRFKVYKDDSWSNQLNCEWAGGTGYIKFSVALNENQTYRLRVEPDYYEPGVYTNMSGSDFYKADENCFVWQIVGVDGEKSAQIPK